jgi:hypothetical protein
LQEDYRYKADKRLSPSEGGSGGAPSGQFLFLSLFLILLAFFIAMTAGATFDDDRTDPILGSLEKVFPVKNFRGVNLPSQIRGQTLMQNQGQSLSSAESIFTADSFPFSVRTSRETGALAVTLKTKDLEEMLGIAEARVVTDKQKQIFYANLATLTQPSSEGRAGFHMGVEIYTDRHITRMVKDDKTVFNANVKRVEGYVKGFVNAGLDKDRIFTLIQKGDQNDVRLIFTPASQKNNKGSL